jgi:hypothetical protein
MEHGSFVFRNEGDGCMTSKYMNDSAGPFTECCTLIKAKNSHDVFCGTWHSAWLENNGEPGNATLKIDRQKSNAKLFELTWTDNGGAVLFSGLGMLYEGFLVGTYWDK